MWYKVKLTSQAIGQIETIVQYISKVLFVPETRDQIAAMTDMSFDDTER